MSLSPPQTYGKPIRPKAVVRIRRCQRVSSGSSKRAALSSTWCSSHPRSGGSARRNTQPRREWRDRREGVRGRLAAPRGSCAAQEAVPRPLCQQAVADSGRRGGAIEARRLVAESQRSDELGIELCDRYLGRRLLRERLGLVLGQACDEVAEGRLRQRCVGLEGSDALRHQPPADHELDLGLCPGAGRLSRFRRSRREQCNNSCEQDKTPHRVLSSSDSTGSFRLRRWNST